MRETGKESIEVNLANGHNHRTTTGAHLKHHLKIHACIHTHFKKTNKYSTLIINFVYPWKQP